jgi:hypothetical protein
MEPLSKERIIALASESSTAHRILTEELSEQEMEDFLGDRAIDGGKKEWPKDVGEYIQIAGILQSPLNIKDYLGITERLKVWELERQRDRARYAD